MKTKPLSYARPGTYREPPHSRLGITAFVFACAGLTASVTGFVFVSNSIALIAAGICIFGGMALSTVGIFLAIPSLYRGRRNLYGWWAFYLSMVAWILFPIIYTMALD